MNIWNKTSDILPPEGKYVIVRYNGGNWIDNNDPKNVNCVIARLIKGISMKEREQLSDTDERKRKYIKGDEHSNNIVNYAWQTFGILSFFGQEVSEWAYIPEH